MLTSMSELSSQPVCVYTLTRKIAAIQVAGSRSGLGLFTELPKGAQIEILGCGFSDVTVKVRYHEQLYFVFRQDIGFDGVDNAA